MLRHFRLEFMRDVVAVARAAGLTRAQGAWDFGLLENSAPR